MSGKNIGARPTKGSISGDAYRDANVNNQLDIGETRLSGRTVYVDLNNNRNLDAGEPLLDRGVVGEPGNTSPQRLNFLAL